MTSSSSSSWQFSDNISWSQDWDIKDVYGKLYPAPDSPIYHQVTKCPNGHLWSKPQVIGGDDQNNDLLMATCTICGDKAFLQVEGIPPTEDLYKLIEQIEEGADWGHVLTKYDLIMRRLEKARAVQAETETVLKIVETLIAKHVESFSLQSPVPGDQTDQPNDEQSNSNPPQDFNEESEATEDDSEDQEQNEPSHTTIIPTD